MPAVPALATLGDATQIEMILSAGNTNTGEGSVQAISSLS